MTAQEAFEVAQNINKYYGNICDLASYRIIEVDDDRDVYSPSCGVARIDGGKGFWGIFTEYKEIRVWLSYTSQELPG